ncbi:MAG: hypothetical protein KAU38_10240 [Desulfobacterales bacterium]|nr:hypothetical protein [Desulfobacterales bacterium]
MEKMLKVPLMMLAVTLSIFLVAGNAHALCCCFDGPPIAGNQVPCPGGSTNGGPDGLVCYDCGDVVAYTGSSAHATDGCTFVAHMGCRGAWPCCEGEGHHVHGLIIGAAGALPATPLVIDGAGFTLHGREADEHCCEVDIMGIEPSDGACTGHPCRIARFASNDGVNNYRTIDSGILNADPVTGQGGFDNVTVRNLTITGFCDGIFMSGDCTPTQRQLTGILIEGNCIHDNGKDCGCYEHVAGEEGYYQWPNFNDGIFLAQVGIKGPTPGEYPDCEECKKGDTECPDLRKMGRRCVPLQSRRNIVRHNRIWNQRGCGKIACPGGSGINLNGGLEYEEPFHWCGCNEIAKNVIENCAMSGVVYTHATVYNRIHGNICKENGYGGITDPCNWCEDTYIYGNCACQNLGVGIGVAAANTKIKNNRTMNTGQVPELCGKRDLPYNAWQGFGILVGGDAGNSEVVGNISCANLFLDVMDASGTGIWLQNMCDNPGGSAQCQYNCCDWGGCQ